MVFAIGDGLRYELAKATVASGGAQYAFHALGVSVRHASDCKHHRPYFHAGKSEHVSSAWTAQTATGGVIAFRSP